MCTALLGRNPQVLGFKVPPVRSALSNVLAVTRWQMDSTGPNGPTFVCWRSLANFAGGENLAVRRHSNLTD